MRSKSKSYHIDLLKWLVEEKDPTVIPTEVLDALRLHVQGRKKKEQFFAPFKFEYTDSIQGDRWSVHSGNNDGPFSKPKYWTCSLERKPSLQSVKSNLNHSLQSIIQELETLKGKVVSGDAFLAHYLTGHRGQFNLEHIDQDQFQLEYYLTTGRMGAFASIKESAGIITRLKISCFIKTM